MDLTIYNLKTWKDGVGTRISGEKLRKDIQFQIGEGVKSIVLDFEDIKVISSGFADELLGKLMVELGYYAFNNLVILNRKWF